MYCTIFSNAILPLKTYTLNTHYYFLCICTFLCSNYAEQSKITFSHDSGQTRTVRGNSRESKSFVTFALIDKFPEFKAMYRTLYEMCLNTERVMEMFSEELRILDRNTVKYMIEEQQNQLSQQSEELERLRAEIQSLRNQIVS